MEVKMAIFERSDETERLIKVEEETRVSVSSDSTSMKKKIR